MYKFKLSRKALLLWYIRLFAVLMIWVPAAESLGAHPLWVWGGVAIIGAALLGAFYLRYRSCLIIISSDGLQLQIGVLIRKDLYLRSSQILAVSYIYTPLSRRFSLCNTVLYCEGAAFILPPLEKAATKLIEQNIKSGEQPDEA